MQVRFNMVNCFVVRPDESGAGHELLQLRRRHDDFMGGTWQTVYGQSEADETAPAAAMRELREETALYPAQLYRLERVSVFYIIPEDTLWHCVQFCAIVKRSDSLQLNSEHDAQRWLPIDKAEDFFMWHEDRHSIREIRREILANGLSKPHIRVPLSPHV